MSVKKIAASLFSLGMVAAPFAHATNGDEMMAVGSQSTALGGTGVANYIGAESLWANPAMLGKSKGSEVTGGVNLFKPKVTNTGMPGSNQPQPQVARRTRATFLICLTPAELTTA